MRHIALIALALAITACETNRAPPAPALPVPPELSAEVRTSCLHGIALLADGLFSTVLLDRNALRAKLLECEARRGAGVAAYYANRDRIIQFNAEHAEDPE